VRYLSPFGFWSDVFAIVVLAFAALTYVIRGVRTRGKTRPLLFLISGLLLVSIMLMVYNLWLLR